MVRPEIVTGRYRLYPQKSQPNRPFLGRGRGESATDTQSWKHFRGQKSRKYRINNK